MLDSQLRRDSGLAHFEYVVLAMLSEAPDHTLRMTALARRTNATLPRLSHVVRRLEERNLVERFPCPEDGRATNARLTAAGVTQVRQLRGIAESLLTRLDPDGHMSSLTGVGRPRSVTRGTVPAGSSGR